MYLYKKVRRIVMDEVRNRIREALNLRGMKQIELAERTGISQQKLNPWINQRWQPKQDSLYKMAKVLDVSELWLAGYNVAMERPVGQKKMDQLAESILKVKSNERYRDVVVKITKLDEDQLSIVENLLNQFIKE